MSKKIISQQEFNKKLEMEAAHLEYMDRLKWHEAQKKAQQIISEEYEVEKKS